MVSLSDILPDLIDRFDETVKKSIRILVILTILLVIHFLEIGFVQRSLPFYPVFAEFSRQYIPWNWILAVHASLSVVLIAYRYIDKRVQEERKENRERFQQIVAGELAPQLDKYGELLFAWYATSKDGEDWITIEKRSPENIPDTEKRTEKTVIEHLEDRDFSHIQRLDLSYAHLSKSELHSHSIKVFSETEEAIDKVLQPYATYLDGEFVDQLLDLRRANLHAYVKAAKDTEGLGRDRKSGNSVPLLMGFGEDMFQEAVETYLDIISDIQEIDPQVTDEMDVYTNRNLLYLKSQYLRDKAQVEMGQEQIESLNTDDLADRFPDEEFSFQAYEQVLSLQREHYDKVEDSSPTRPSYSYYIPPDSDSETNDQS